MASGKATTRKLTGRAKDNFFESGLTPEEAKAAVTSLQVRKDLWPVSKDLRPKSQNPATPPVDIPTKKKALPENIQPTTTTPKASESPSPLPSRDTPTPMPPSKSTGDFDPFVFGLVPVFKREGASGLAARLGEIDDVENLRAMAKAQQIILPRDVRRGDATIESVRTAVLAAVEQRVTDRKAQL